MDPNSYDLTLLSTKYTAYQVEKIRNHVPIIKHCVSCGNEFDAKSYVFRTTAIYEYIREACSDQCKKRAIGMKNKKVHKGYICEGCKCSFVPHPKKPHQRFCSKKCRGKTMRCKRPEVYDWIHKIKPPKHSVSKWGTEWLSSFTITNPEHPIIINGKQYIVDGFDASTNTIYEYLGSFWHGNPDIYNPNDIHPVTKTTFGELYQKTLARIATFEREGYTVIYTWSPR